MAEGVLRFGPSVFGDRIRYAYRPDGTEVGRLDGREAGPGRFIASSFATAFEAGLTAPELRAIADELERLERTDGHDGPDS